MGNQIAPIDEQFIHKKLSNKIEQYGKSYEDEHWKIVKMDDSRFYNWNKLFTIDTKMLEKIKRSYIETDPASHLLRLKLIWKLSPLVDICKQIWKSYLFVYSENKYDKNHCIVCCAQWHSYLKCDAYRKCVLCLELGHNIQECPSKCECGIIHFKQDHQCQLCKEFGHIAQKCPSRSTKIYVNACIYNIFSIVFATQKFYRSAIKAS